MKNNFLTLAFALAAVNLSSQVGINTQSPKATLEVVGKPGDTNHFDGIIPPRITGDELAAKIYSTAQKGAFVFYLPCNQSNGTGRTPYKNRIVLF